MRLQSIIMPLVLGVVSLATAGSLFGQNAGMNKAVAEFCTSEVLEGASVGICISELGGANVAGHNIDQVLIPASSQKVLTCATALEVFPITHRFATKLAYSGGVVDGVLQGDLHIIGGGDPALGSTKFGAHYDSMMVQMVAAVQAAGILEIQGGIVLDGSYFDNEVLVGSTPVADAGNYYGGGAHALSYKDNRYVITFSSENRDGGETTVVSTSPTIPRLKLKNLVRASSENTDNAYVYAVPGESFQVVRGTIPMGKASFEIKAAIPQPGLILAQELKDALAEQKIKTTANTRFLEGATHPKKKASTLTEIHSIESPKLKALVLHTLEKSDNSYADILLKHIGKRLADEGSFSAGVSAVKAHWADRLPNVDAMYVYDGSGLSRLNGLSAAQLAGVCANLDPKVVQTMRDGMKPLSKGTRIMAKSGTINRVKSYTGYFEGATGQTYAFSVIVNNYATSHADIKRRITYLLESLCKL